ncbi:MAG: hypothetical protein U1E74_09935 [Paenacidovorax caeni]
MSRFFNNLKLVNKVLLMVGLLGSLSVLITVFALLNMRAIDRSYRDLLAVDVQAAILIDGALLEMNEASRLVFAVLTEQEEARMRAVGRDIATAQERFARRLTAWRRCCVSSRGRWPCVRTRPRWRRTRPGSWRPPPAGAATARTADHP